MIVITRNWTVTRNRTVSYYYNYNSKLCSLFVNFTKSHQSYGAMESYGAPVTAKKTTKNLLCMPCLNRFKFFSFRFLLGSVVGVGIGMFVEQNYSEIPDVKTTFSDFIEDIKKAAKPKK